MLKHNAFGEKLKSSPCTQRGRFRAAQGLAVKLSGAMIERIASGIEAEASPVTPAMITSQIRGETEVSPMSHLDRCNVVERRAYFTLSRLADSDRQGVRWRDA